MNVMFVKTNKLEFLAIDHDFFSEETKCFVLFRLKRNMQPDVHNFETNISIELFFAF